MHSRCHSAVGTARPRPRQTVLMPAEEQQHWRQWNLQTDGDFFGEAVSRQPSQGHAQPSQERHFTCVQVLTRHSAAITKEEVWHRLA
jgi:hypothetical protein